jgi:hypothetical protein
MYFATLKNKTAGRTAIGLILIALYAPPTLSQERKPPTWITKRPRLDGYFVGIGVAQRDVDLAASRGRALDHALEDIGAQIQLGISSETQLREEERAGHIKQFYSSEIRTVISATLEGVDIVDTWENASNCWVYARLSRARLDSLAREKIRHSSNLIATADKRGPAELVGSLSLYIQALAPLQELLGDPLWLAQRGPAAALRAEVSQRIQNILTAVHLRAVPPVLSLKRGDALDIPLAIEATFEDETAASHPVQGLPLRFAFTRGDADLVPRAWSDARGMAVSRLYKIANLGRTQIVEVQIDLEVMGCPQAARFPLPSTTIRLEIAPCTAFISSSESNLGERLASPYLEPLIKAELGAFGLDFTEQPQEADLLIQINALTRQGDHFQGLHFSFLDMTFAVVEGSSGNEVFKTSLNNIKGSGTSSTRAGIRAFEKAGDRLRKLVLDHFADIVDTL